MADSKLENIIEQALGEKDSDGSVKTTVVNLHLSQMREWGVRGGNIQFKAVQDFNKIRANFINRIIQKNEIKNRLDSIMDNLAARGEILWLLSVDELNESGYSVEYFVGGKKHSNPEYHVFRYPKKEIRELKTKPTNNIKCVCIKTSEDKDMASVDTVNAHMLSALQGSLLKDWYLTFFDSEKIIEFKLAQEPKNLKSWYHLYYQYKQNNAGDSIYTAEVFENPFAPDIPIRISPNVKHKKKEIGVDDFSPHADLIEEHNELLMSASDNISIFNNPTLITSREATTVLDSIKNQENELILNSWAGQQGYRSVITKHGRTNYRMPKVIGNVREGERFGYIQTPDAVSGDQNIYIRQLRELLHWMLGGVDPLGISSSATFGEIKSLFGRIENTAMKKSESLLGENGLCSLLSLAIKQEEKKAKVAIIKYIVARFLSSPENAGLIERELDDSSFRNLFFYITEEEKLELPGLPPLGKATCSWRYTKPVYSNTTREQLDESIIYRNKREDGISQEQALSQLYPTMSDEELRQAMSGFSPRVVQSGLDAILSALQAWDRFMRVPDPSDPESGVPWAIKLRLHEIIEQGVITLQKEMQYNIPDFKEAPDYENINLQLSSLLEKLSADVRSTIPPTNPVSLSSAYTTAAARNGNDRRGNPPNRSNRKS